MTALPRFGSRRRGAAGTSASSGSTGPGTARPSGAARARRRQAPLPLWLRGRRHTGATRVAPTPREARWWIGVTWLLLSVLMLSFVGHVTLFGALQHSRVQEQKYQELRTSLAKATTPLGQLDTNGAQVPAGTPIALLTIDRLGISEVVSEGTAPGVLRGGPGHRRDSVYPGQAGTSVIFGRQSTYGGPFGGLSALAPGDTITVTTGQGVSKFTVLQLRRPGDLLPQPLGAGEGRLQLVTAGGPALAPTGTLYVDADLDGTAKEAAARVFSTAALDPGEQPMQTDPNAGLPFIFALQWLLIAAIIARWLASRWGRWQVWLVCSPVLLALGATTADAAMALLPNLL